MFSLVHSTLNNFTNICDDVDYCDNHKKFIEKLQFKQFEKILNIINYQQPFLDAEYCIFKYSFEELNLDLVSYIFDKMDNFYHTNVDILDNNIILNIFTPYYLANYLKKNQNIKNIFLTFNYNCGAKNFAHQAGFLIDNNNKKIFLIDPNGSPSYFNNIIGSKIDYIIEKMLYDYFSLLKLFDLNYEYIYTFHWNQKEIYMNKFFNNDFLGSGHCVILTLMIIYLVNELDKPIDQIYEIFDKLEDEEILYLIKIMTSCVYCLLN
ncbi:Hypothetical protein KVN_LOCUS294 [uncultured virus]|nr:Hypothetical protein KVN_LOCUS294 [uncultured virus]